MNGVKAVCSRLHRHVVSGQSFPCPCCIFDGCTQQRFRPTTASTFYRGVLLPIRFMLRRSPSRLVSESQTRVKRLAIMSFWFSYRRTDGTSSMRIAVLCAWSFIGPSVRKINVTLSHGRFKISGARHAQICRCRIHDEYTWNLKEPYSENDWRAVQPTRIE
jgi:hypothetical protein